MGFGTIGGGAAVPLVAMFSKYWNALRFVSVLSSSTDGLGSTCGGVCEATVLADGGFGGVGVCVASVRVATWSVLVALVCTSVCAMVPSDRSGIVGVCVR